MNSESVTVRLGELCSKIGSGATPRGGDAVYLQDGVSLIRSQNVHNGQFRIDGLARIGKEHAEQLDGVAVRQGDVLLNITGDSVARACLVPSEVLPARVNQHVAIVRPDSQRLDSRFLLYLLISPSMQRHLLGLAAAGATRKALTKSIVEDLVVPGISLAEQRRIGGVLGALDDKIDCCRRIVGRLEELLSASFGKQFVQSPDLEGATVSLASIARFVNGRAFTKDANGRARPILRIRELNTGIDDSTPRSDIQAHEDNIARHADLLFSWSGSLDVYRWSGPESLINQHIFKVVPDGAYPAWFVEGWIRHHLPEFQAIASGKATTMGHIQRHHLDEAQVVLPRPDELLAARRLLDPLDGLRSRLALEMRDLIAIRDALLPKLVSGQMRVPVSYEPPAEAAA